MPLTLLTGLLYSWKPMRADKSCTLNMMTRYLARPDGGGGPRPSPCVAERVTDTWPAGGRPNAP